MLLSREPRWNGSVLGDRSAPRGRADEFVAPVDDIFRVWTTSQTNTPAFSEDPPFTPQGRAGYESFDDLLADCEPDASPERDATSAEDRGESWASGDTAVDVETARRRRARKISFA